MTGTEHTVTNYWPTWQGQIHTVTNYQGDRDRTHSHQLPTWQGQNTQSPITKVIGTEHKVTNYQGDWDRTVTNYQRDADRHTLINYRRNMAKYLVQSPITNVTWPNTQYSHQLPTSHGQIPSTVTSYQRNMTSTVTSYQRDMVSRVTNYQRDSVR